VLNLPRTCHDSLSHGNLPNLPKSWENSDSKTRQNSKFPVLSFFSICRVLPSLAPSFANSQAVQVFVESECHNLDLNTDF
jgi:hypothetical protein